MGKSKYTERRSITIKGVFVGQSGVGKTSIVSQLVKGQFHEQTESTVGADFITHRIQLSPTLMVKFHMFDSAGQEMYEAATSLYYKRADVGIVVYSMNMESSYARAVFWVNILKNASDDILIVLARNKSDLSADTVEATIEEAQAYANFNDLIFTEVSAKTGMGVHEMFTQIAEVLVQRGAGEEVKTGLKLTRTQQNKRPLCCQ